MYILTGCDFVFCLIATIIDVVYFNGNKFGYFIIHFLVFGSIIISTDILLLLKRRKLCMIAGFLYLIGGSAFWLGKLIFFIIMLILSRKDDKSFEDSYENIQWIVFIMNILTIFLRLGSAYIIKLMYKPVCSLESYFHEKEHAEFVQSLGKRNPNEDKLVEDDEITEDQLYPKNQNPFIKGREKKEDNEDEEINFDST